MFNRDNNFIRISVDSLKNIRKNTTKKLKTVALLGTYALVLSGCSKEMPTVDEQYETIIAYETSNGQENTCSSIAEIEDRKDIKEIVVQNLTNPDELDGINKIEGLDSIGIYSPIIDDLSELDGITTTSLTIFDASIKDWSFLNNIKGVEDLCINNTNLSDTAFLSNMKNLESLDLSENFITKLDDSNLDSLKYLYLRNNSIKNIDFSKYPKLKDVIIIGNYNLFTKENNEYLKQHYISHDFTDDDIEYINSIKKDLNSLGLNNSDKMASEEEICKYVLNKMQYDNEALIKTGRADECNEKILKCFVEGKGICVNFAEGFDACLELSGINSYSVMGYINNDTYQNYHKWSIVEINGQYFLCDLTFSDVDPLTTVHNAMFEDSPHPYINSVGKVTKSYSDYHETDAFGNSLINTHGIEASNITSKEGKNKDNKNKLFYLLRAGSVVLIAGAIGKKILGDIQRKIRRKKEIEEKERKHAELYRK